MKNSNSIAIGLIILFALILPLFNLTNYLMHLIIYSLIWVIMTQGLNIIQGFTGYVSIAQAAFFGVGAYGSALISIKFGLSSWITVPLAIVITGIFAILIGFPALKTKGHYFAIVTMSFCMIVWVVMVSWMDFTGGEAGLTGIPKMTSFLGLDFSNKVVFYYFVLFVVILTIVFIYRFINSKIGRALITIRENEQLAQAIGIPIFKYKMLAFVLSAMFAGLAGGIYAHYSSFINPTPFTVDYSLNAILAVIIGGSGTIVGPIIGSFIMIFLPEYLRVVEEYRLIIYGVILILLMIYMPKGIVSIFKNLFQKYKVSKN